MSHHSLLEQVACNLCGGVDVRVLQPALHSFVAKSLELTTIFRSSSDSRLTHQLVACVNCGLQYVSPRLRADAVIEGYATGSDEGFVSQSRGRELTASRCLDLIERVWKRPVGRLLDIGTGGASFPYVASRRGWEVDACEPNRWLCEWAQSNYGIPVRPGTVFEQAYQGDSYEVVTLWDVLEHTPDPKTEIREAHRLLKQDGLLVVNYPDIGSWIARVMGRSWVFLLDVHLYYFTRSTIAKLLTDAGFEVAFVRPHYQRLSLGYILHRASTYVGAPARLAGRMAALVGLADIQVPYWMGQTLVMARKRLRTAETTPSV